MIERRGAETQSFFFERSLQRILVREIAEGKNEIFSRLWNQVQF